MIINGNLNLPGDKSISHRAVMLASLAKGKSEIRNLSSAKDVASTISCLANCGIQFNNGPGGLFVNGGMLKDPDVSLDCGNSGTTMRLLIGLLSGQGINATLIGDESLSSRPMKRVINPLKKMGVDISSNNYKSPIEIRKSQLKGINYESPIASAQIKSCILFAGIGAIGSTTYTEPNISRNHSEIMLNNIGVTINSDNMRTAISFSEDFKPLNFTIPSDPSTASFFIAAAILIPDSRLILNRILLNKISKILSGYLLKVRGEDIYETITNYRRHFISVCDCRLWIIMGWNKSNTIFTSRNF